jgi:hypothetical protein
MKIGEINTINKKMQTFGYLYILSIVRRCQFKWVGHFNRIDRNRKISDLFKNNPQGSRMKRRSKKMVEMCTNRF